MIEAKTPREKRAVAILAEKDTINKVDDDLFTVKSRTGVGQYRIEHTTTDGSATVLTTSHAAGSANTSLRRGIIGGFSRKLVTASKPNGYI